MRVLLDAERALNVPSFEHSLPDELRADFELIESTHRAAVELQKQLKNLARSKPGLRELLHQIRFALKHLGFQLKDVQRFRESLLGERHIPAPQGEIDG